MSEEQDVEEFAAELRDELDEMIDAAESVIDKLNQLIEGEITYDEYEEWVDNNEETLKALSL